jgi:hypothetical protein
MASDEAVVVPSRAASSKGAQTMTDKTIDLDRRGGMKTQKATDLRRLLVEVEANERTLRLRQDELEARLANNVLRDQLTAAQPGAAERRGQ